MKQYWQRIESKIDAMSLRERAMAFAIAALALVTLIDTFMLDSLLKQQREASQRITQDQQQIAALQAEIQARVASHDKDPDNASRIRLNTLRQEAKRLRDELMSMQKGLVSPDKMALLLEDMLKKNGRLKLASLKTLPVAPLAEPPAPEQDAKKAGAAKEKEDGQPALDVIYKHGVEIVVQGSYADMLSYLAELETMPWQLFWANAKLDATTYPQSTLTLTLFTLSLDKKWLYI